MHLLYRAVAEKASLVIARSFEFTLHRHSFTCAFVLLFAYCFDAASPTLHLYLHSARGLVNCARKGALSNLLAWGEAARQQNATARHDEFSSPVPHPAWEATASLLKGLPSYRCVDTCSGSAQRSDQPLSDLKADHLRFAR